MPKKGENLPEASVCAKLGMVTPGEVFFELTFVYTLWKNHPTLIR